MHLCLGCFPLIAEHDGIEKWHSFHHHKSNFLSARVARQFLCQPLVVRAGQCLCSLLFSASWHPTRDLSSFYTFPGFTQLVWWAYVRRNGLDVLPTRVHLPQLLFTRIHVCLSWKGTWFFSKAIFQLFPSSHPTVGIDIDWVGASVMGLGFWFQNRPSHIREGITA